MEEVKTCKLCGAKSNDVKWRKNYGVVVGSVCLACRNSANSAKVALTRATADGKAKSDKASKKYYSSEKGTANTLRKKEAEGAKERKNKASLDWAKRHPGKALAKVRKRELTRLERVPAWADHAKIKDFYINRPNGMAVDHIIPLNGLLVSGLHCESNLQYLCSKENSSKGNNFDPMTFEGP